MPATTEDAEQRIARIRARIQEPRFPDHVVDVTHSGAVGDGVTDCTAAIAEAVSRCSAAGGGRVLVPAGRYRTGAVHLLDDVELHVAEGAVLEFSRDPADYLPVVRTRYEGVDCYNYSPFVYAVGRRNVALTGRGTLDGRAGPQHWWNWVKAPAPDEGPAKQRLLAAAAAGVPVEERVFGEGHHLRPSMVQLYDCTDVLVEGLTFRRSPMWTLHPVLCTNVTIRDVTVDSHGNNNDGCNPESCRDVLILGCTFDTGDDCIAVKSGKDADGRAVGVPSERIAVLDCRMRAGHGGVTLGSETSGGIRDVVAYRCEMSSPELKRALRIKSNPDRGGYVRDVLFADIEVGTVSQAAVEIALDYGRVTTGEFPPEVADIEVRGLRVGSAGRALNLVGLPDAPIRGLRLRDCTFERVAEPDVVRHVVDSDLGEAQQLPQR
ncbi:glycoside hydrolase family 28 protein [Desertihabitans aurantiacus]|uniref:glycoside hydrolase family 28 protein n=1 Tax=Desertihabitans aurantiacus TaxID=2282477 RepID=UPI001E33AAAC|nr:glycoside hydrolase family 28 protein [Desertihabitans aurantiacus]